MKTLVIRIVLFLLSSSTIIFSQSPELVYSTFIGSSGWEYGHAIGVDSQGCAYISGQVHSPGFPTTPGAFDRSHNSGADVYVSKLSQDGSSLVYSTFIGGTGRDDTRDIFVDQTGRVYISGSSTSLNFPKTENAIQDTSDIFVLKLNPDGSGLDYCGRYLYGETFIVDNDGYLLCIGQAVANGFAATENTYADLSAGSNDAYLLKFDINTNTVVFATLFGGSSNDHPLQVAVDQANNIIVSGMTKSEDFPVTGENFCKFGPDKNNVFITKFNSDGSEILASTLVGGSDEDVPWGMTIDHQSNVYVTGRTNSDDFPTSANAIKKSRELRDGFLFKLNADASQLVYSTYIGGSGNDDCRDLVVDSDGKAYVTGCTHSTDFPVTEDAYMKTFQGGGTDDWSWGDVFLLVMDPTGDEIEYATFLGGRNDDEAYKIAINEQDVYLCGTTPSSNFPTTDNAFDKTFNGNVDAYVTKFSFNSTSDVKSQNRVPMEYKLYQNYPNPFNPMTYIRYTLDHFAHVKLSIFNTVGQVVKTPVNTTQNPGEYSTIWNGTDDNGNKVSSGIYFYQLTANNVQIQKKMLFLQ